MKNLRIFRIVLAAIFLTATLAYIFLGPQAHPMARAVEDTQIIPSLLSITIGATVFWLAITFLLGRIYCSTACPVGTLIDLAAKLRRFVPRARKVYHYRPARNMRYHLLLIYLICLLVGIAIVPLIIEPWNIIRNISLAFHPDRAATVWLNLGLGTMTGILAGCFSLLLILLSAVWCGRDFCNDICPIGTMLGAVDRYTLYHIEIDPDKCINCMKCEEVCKSQCVKVVGRLVDNSRCVRCMDCLSVCPNDAIRLQINRNQRATPLMRRRRSLTP